MKKNQLSRTILVIIVLAAAIMPLSMIFRRQTAYSADTYTTSQIDSILASSWNGYKNTMIQGGKVVRLDQGGDTVSEGQGYAMMRAVYMNDKTSFDAIWNWTQSNLSRMNNPTQNDRDHLFAWDYKDHVLDWSSATDADEDIAIALVFANHKWGDTTYMSSAKDVMNDILNRDTVKGSDGKRYITGGSYGIYEANPDMDPSYLSPAYYKVFAQASGNTDWNGVVDASYAVLQKSVTDQLDTNAGLFPNWVSFNPSTLAVTPINTSDRNTDYTYDAFRTPFRLALDKIWFNDQRANDLLTGKLETFFKSQMQKNGEIYAEYHHDGSVKNAYESSAIYGGDIGVFVASQDTADTNTVESKIVGDYHDNGGNGYFGSGSNNYYGNNWAWFGLLIANNEATNITGSGSTTTQASATPASSSGIITNAVVEKTYTISFDLNSTNFPQTYLVDVEVKDQNNNKIGQMIKDSMTEHDSKTHIDVTWKAPANVAAGTYPVDVGIFTNDWSTLHTWISGATSITTS